MGEGRVRTAACIAVGSELLEEDRLDTNSLTVTRVLLEHGVRVVEKRVLGDDEEVVSGAIRELMARVDLVVVTGGLGPTADDVTREAVARALGVELVHDPAVEAWIRARYAEFGREMPEVCTSMAMVVPGARVLRNARGSAPGILVERDGAILAVFPGVPREMERMLREDLVPLLEERGGGRRRLRRTLLVSGLVESEVEDRIRHLYRRYGRENVTILAAQGLVRLVLHAEGTPEEATSRLDEMERAFREGLGDHVAGVDVEGLAEVVLDLLRGRGQGLATAESCTGGLLGAMLTGVPGSSDVFRGGVVSYCNEAKESLLGVPHATLVEHGAVSEPVARAMAEGARSVLGCDWGIGITGIAGPGGGTPEKPVGLVHWAVAGPEGTVHRSRVFPGSRSFVRRWAANAALDLLRRMVSGGEAP